MYKEGAVGKHSAYLGNSSLSGNSGRYEESRMVLDSAWFFI